MKKCKPYLLAAALLLMLLLLTACSSTMDTTMTLSETFSGQREIICTLSGNLSGGQENTLKELVETNCPSELTHTFVEADGKKTAVFTLTFSSEQDYVQKLEAVLGRKPAVSFRRTNTIFCQGMTYSEDFSSRELLAWLDEPMQTAGLVKKDQSVWKIEKPRLVFGGNTYTSKGERLEIVDTATYPVEKLTVNTLLNKAGSFERTVTISIPKRTADALGGQLTAYLNKLEPNGVISDSASGVEFTASISGATAEQLSQWTAAVLDSEHTSTSLETDGSVTTRFIEQSVLNESLDYSSFYNENGKIYVNYLFSVEAPYEFAGVQLNREGEWIEAPGFDPAVGYIQQEEVAATNIRLTFRKQFAVTDVLLYTEKTGSDQYMRRVTLQFDQSKGLEGPQELQSYMHELGFSDTTLQNDSKGNCVVTVTVKGGIADIGGAMASMFGEGNTMTYKVNGGFFSFVQAVDLTETVDMTGFLKELGYAGTVKYTLADGFDPLNKAAYSTPEGDIMEEKLDGEFNLSLEQIAPVSLSFTGSKTNTVLLVLVAIIALAVILALIFLFSKWLRKSDRKRRALPAPNVVPLPPQPSVPEDGGVQNAELPPYPDVDGGAVTQTIELDKQPPQEPLLSMSTKRRKKDQYADAMSKLSATPKAGSAAKSYKEEKKQAEAARQEKEDAPVQEDKAAEPALCAKCGKPLRINAQFCNYCGLKTQEAEPQKKCPVCGGDLDGRFAFCSKCGTKTD